MSHKVSSVKLVDKKAAEEEKETKVRAKKKTEPLSQKAYKEQ